MTTVAFGGLGIMDGPMARNLVSAGYDAAGFSRSRGPVEALVAHGGRAGGSGAEAVPVEPTGSGQTVKAASKLIVAGAIELAAEAIVFLRAYGPDHLALLLLVERLSDRPPG